MKKNIKKTIRKITDALIILLFIYGISAFFVGIKNMDSGHNLLRYNYFCEEENETFQEMTLNYKLMDSSRAYIMGMRQIIIGFYACFISAYLIGKRYYTKKE